MEPRIQYAKTSDGVSIAYWAMGDGPPLVIPPLLFTSHLQTTWQNPEQRAALEQLGRRAQVIAYDCRGAGMSQCDALDFSFEAALLDLDAVVDRLGLERFAVYNDWRMGAVAFAYAASHPDRVSHLIHWWRAFRLPISDIARRQRALDPLIEQEWDMYTEIWARVILGWDSPDASSMAAAFRAAHTPASFQLADKALSERSPEPFLAAIQTPTLILYPVGDKDAENSVRVLASAIDTAHVVAIPMALRSTGTISAFPNEIGVNAILDFINSSPAAPGQPIPAPQVDVSAVRTILWTDIEDHSAMMERFGDAKGREVLREHERITRQALAAHGGTEVKAMGDGFMAWFSSTQKALECAVALQRAFAVHNQSASEPLLVRVGVNAGEPIAEEDDLFGASVIATARICRAAQGSEIVVADVVRQLAAGKDFLFSDRGEVALRGFEDPVRLYEVRWREEA